MSPSPRRRRTRSSSGSAATSVNMGDLDYLFGRPRFARIGTGLRSPRDKALGLDVAGVVEAVGPLVSRFAAGDEVFGDLTQFGFGAFAEYALAPEKAFARKPPSLTFEEAATLPQAAVMALQGLTGKRPVKAWRPRAHQRRLRQRRAVRGPDRQGVRCGGHGREQRREDGPRAGCRRRSRDRLSERGLHARQGRATTASSTSMPATRCSRAGAS